MSATADRTVLVIHGPDAHTQLAENPGIYVGHFPIPLLFRLPGHTATAESSNAGLAVTELVGLWTHLFQQIQMHRPTPYYGHFSEYRWVRVAGVEVLEQYRRAAGEARAAYHGRLYTASSNRFVSTVLRKSGIVPTAEMLRAIGWAPGIRWRFRF